MEQDNKEKKNLNLDTDKYIIVSKFPSTVEFIRREFPEFAQAKVTKFISFSNARGKIIAGNVPVPIASAAERVYMVHFRGPVLGEVIGIDEMYERGAVIKIYEVIDRNPEVKIVE